jgi:hypothetical protein
VGAIRTASLHLHSSTIWLVPFGGVIKAIRIHPFGGVDTLVLEDVPQTEIGEDQVLIRVHEGEKRSKTKDFAA